jgi:hypothetical protein
MGSLMTHHHAARASRDRQAGRQGSHQRRPAPPERRRRLRTLVVLILVVGAVVIGASAKVRRTGFAAPDAAVSGSPVPASGVWLGVQVAPGSTESVQKTLGNLETRVRRRFDLVYQQLPWDEPLERVSALEAGAQERIPLLGWNPTYSNGSIVPWPRIATGKEDARLTAMATRLKAVPRRVFLAFAHQPETEIGNGHGTAADYALAYRHVHDLFASLGVANVVWVWSMTSATKWASLHAQLYPGDAYVDWLAFDVAGSGCDPGSPSRSFAGVTGPFHRWVATRHPGKPIMVTGYGHVRDPAVARPEADRLAADLSVLRTRRPEIKAVVYASARARATCGRGMAASSTSATSLPATGPAGRGGKVATAASARACLSRDPTRVTRVDGTVPTYRMGSVADGRTYDLRRATIVGYPNASRYALLFGKQGPGAGTCVLGGRIVGQQSRAFSWHTMKQRLDGDGLNFRSQGGIVDGIRIDNVEDGIGTIGGDPAGITIQNVYLTYIRDDCIENDAIVALRVQDSLLDGCFNGVSERPGSGGSPPPPSPGEALTLDGVLMRLRPMPYDRTRALCAQTAADGLGSGGFFKWSRDANRLVVRDTVLLAERGSVNCGASMSFPDGVYENVTLVWLGEGSYPGRLPPSGVTVTTDRRIWDQARARWLARHGYPATGGLVPS